MSNFLWNSGMFCFKAAVFLEELKLYNAEVRKKNQTGLGKIITGTIGFQLSMAIPSISVDYAVMERSKDQSG
jgi:mannose-1-phosphate guanylyltransferase